MGKPLRVLIVEDSEDDFELMVRELKRGDYDPTYERVETPEALNAALDSQTWDIVIADYNLPHFNALDALALLQEKEIDVPFIVISGTVGEDTAVEIIKAGATDYLMKDRMTRFIHSIERGLREVEERRQLRRAEEELKVLNESLEQRVAEQAGKLVESEETFRNMSAAAQDAIITADSEECISYWNEAAERMFGYSKQEAVGKNVHELIAPKRYRERHSEVYKEFQGTGQGSNIGKTIELAAVRKDGVEFPIELSLSGVKIKGKWNAIGIIRDITERKQAEETIKHMAYHDNLTALPNRMLFVDHLNLELAHARRNRAALAVMFLDLDEFKDVNDTLGHTLGDRLLKEVAARLMKIMRESDTVARLGGDEFTLLLPGINTVENATQVADKVLKEVGLPIVLDNNKLNISTSIGIALYPKGGEDAETLLKNADAAMYRAKEQGRNNFQFFNNLS